MAVYAIGDVQGCHRALLRLLERLSFDAGRDRLWFVGDLVNRGPDSLATLRWAVQNDAAVVCVLGNHDLHLLARAAGDSSRAGHDNLDAVIAAADAPALVDWLRRRPLAHHDEGLDALMVHAGIPPGWDVEKTLREARSVEHELTGPAWKQLLGKLYGNRPDRWHEGLRREDRARFTINALTRMRFCRSDGSLDFAAKGRSAPPGSDLVPWFDHPASSWGGTHLVAGHWSAMGLFRRPGLSLLDTGCVWGGALTALRLDDPDAQPVCVPCGG